MVSDDGRTVAWREVKLGIREGRRVQLIGKGLSGRVVTLGQQLVNDGSAITIVATYAETVSERQKAETQ